jgi:tetratricopeptide (TPR) repeat protein
MNLDSARALRRAGRHAEARAALVRLAADHPSDAVVHYEAACVLDYLGDEAAAVPYYVAAIAGGLPDEELRGAYLGLGSTYRTLGRYAEAEAVLVTGLERFPDANELKVFHAMVLHNRGRSKAAVELLLTVLAQTSADDGIRAYRRAIAVYAEDIDRRWPE